MKRKLTQLYIIVCLVFVFFLSCTNGDQGDVVKAPEEEVPVTIKFYPEYTPIGGMFKNSVSVTIASELKTAKIYYTNDGSTPTEKSIEYKEPFQLTETTVIRAVAMYKDLHYYSMTAYEIDNTNTVPDISTHVASPENNWGDEIIYMMMLDRFNDGEAANNNQGSGEYGTVEGLYNGGDFKGISEKLDYIKNLGVTAIWITPPVKNQYHDGNHAGYHGYWASDFLNTDPHYGSIEEYKNFVDLAHSKGLKVIQDIVVNHIADYFKVSTTGKYDTIASRWSINNSSIPLKQPDNSPWTMNNPTLLTEDEFKYSSFYNWNPMIMDYNDYNQIRTYQVGDLDDLKTDNPVVRSLLRGYFRYWIDKVGIDGYRVDTVYYVEPEFFADFVNSTETDNLGVREYAKSKGKNDFIVFGEAWHRDDEVCAEYTKGTDGDARMDSLIYFPLNLAVRDLASGEKTSLVTEVLNKRYTVGYQNPDKLVTFVDNHDMERLLNKTSPEMVKAAYTIIMTIPGTPQLYYGQEQGFTVARAAMFAGGFKDHGQTNASDLFTESGVWWDYYSALIEMRKNNRVLRYNNLSVIKDTDNGGGIFAYRLVEKDNAGNALTGIDKKALVIINSSDNQKTLYVKSGFQAGDKLVLISPSVNLNSLTEIIAHEDGYISVVIPSLASGVYVLKENGVPYTTDNRTINISTTFSEPVFTSTIISGTLENVTFPVEIELLVDDNEDAPLDSFIVNELSWTKTVDISSISNGLRTMRAKIKGTSVYSDSVTFEYKKPYELVAQTDDPLGDDNGPSGKYIQPTDSTFAGNMQDIKNVKLYTSGGDLKIDIIMKNITRVWKPTVNQFDHVAFSIFVSKPGDVNGVNFQPLHNFTLPDSFKWSYLFKAEGWSTVGFSSIDATISKNGTPISPAPSSSVNWASDTESLKADGVITFTISSQSIGKPQSLSGYKVYINTWDIDMGKLRQIFPEAKAYSFGGGEMETDALIMDETAVITIP
ncbi:MAG: hypothetical protein A2Y29_01215 [Spirochaetes bacterium GWE2_31_10]|nr:MAG: hypothetical protein A2Y30_11675 [Spirochaetes bacterium GWE1_32_154]OHD51177.1 MAG: hypothetical protein A2Y29_01215 [Spirochaetes bacterium GWE2_31_10]